MKKLISLLLALCLLFSLAACGSDPAPTAEPTPSATVEPTAEPFDLAAAAETLAQNLAEGDFSAAAATFSEQLAAQADEQYISEMWASVADGLGDFIGVNSTLTRTGSYLFYGTATAFCEFSEGGLGVITMYDGTGGLASLMFNYYTPVSQFDFAEDGGATPIMWKVTSPEGGEMYLFGSYHLGDESMYALPEAVMSAYEESDALAVEYDLFSAGFDLSSLIELQTALAYTDGSTAKDHLSEETYEMAVQFLTDMGVYAPELEQTSLAQWSAYITVLACNELGLSSNYGIDSYLLNLAHHEGKRIIEIESQASQLELLNSPSDLYFDFMIRSTVEDFDETKEFLSELYAEYRAGNEAALTELLLEDETIDDEYLAGFPADTRSALIEENDAYNERMFTERNVVMTAAALEYLASGEQVFYVVGLGHMLGDDGIVESLRAAGCTVERIEY